MEAKIKRKRKTNTTTSNPPVLFYSTSVKHSNQKPIENGRELEQASKRNV